MTDRPTHEDCRDSRGDTPRCTECRELIVVSTQDGDELCTDCLYKHDGLYDDLPPRDERGEIVSDTTAFDLLGGRYR